MTKNDFKDPTDWVRHILYECVKMRGHLFMAKVLKISTATLTRYLNNPGKMKFKTWSILESYYEKFLKEEAFIRDHSIKY